MWKIETESETILTSDWNTVVGYLRSLLENESCTVVKLPLPKD